MSNPDPLTSWAAGPAPAQWDAGTLIKAIGEAISRADFPAVAAGIKMLTAVDPGRAQDVLGTIQAGLLIREAAP